jgi:hypothetical protein
MIRLGGKHLLRINPARADELQHSLDGGGRWLHRCWGGKYPGKFIELLDGGTEILAATDNGLYYSRTNGESWNKRN